MYTLEQKNKAIGLLEQGESIENIQLQMNIDRNTLRKWQSQFEVSKEKSKEIRDLIKSRKFEKAKELLEEALKLDDDNEVLKSQLVTICIETGLELDEAENIVKARIAQDSQNMQARTQLTLIYIKQGKNDKAEEIANEMLAIDENNLQARSLLILLAKQKMKWTRVIELANEIITIDPQNLPARYQLLTAYRIETDKEKQERIIGEILAIDPENRIREELANATATIPNLRGEVINDFRKNLYYGAITLENLSEYKQYLVCLPTVQQTTLLAEAYTHFNIPKQAISLLKQAQTDEAISAEEKAILTQALQIANSNKMNVIQKRKQWKNLASGERE